MSLEAVPVDREASVGRSVSRRVHLHTSGSETGVGTYVQGLGGALEAMGVGVERTRAVKQEWVVLGKRVGGLLTPVVANRFHRRSPGAALLHDACNWSLSVHGDSVMLHDLNPLVLPKMRSARWMFRFQKALLRRRVILVPSQATKEGVMRWLRCDPEHVHVAPHGIDHEVFQPTRQDRQGYLVYVGDYRPYKRIEEGIEIARRLGLAFIRVGPPGVTQYARRVQELGRRRLGSPWQDAGYVTRNELPLILGRAEALWFPSRWEGFGLPPLEAAACGTPSIVADTPVMRELHGDLAIYADKRDVTMTSIRDAQREPELVQNASQYTWMHSAALHMDAWRQGGLL